MGKRQPYTCPYPGCGKTGKLSGLKQHFRDKHREPVPDARLESLITNGEQLTMTSYNQRALSELPATVWRRAFLSGLALGAAVGISLTIAIGASVISSCQGTADICPASIARLVNTP